MNKNTHKNTIERNSQWVKSQNKRMKRFELPTLSWYRCSTTERPAGERRAVPASIEHVP